MPIFYEAVGSVMLVWTLAAAAAAVGVVVIASILFRRPRRGAKDPNEQGETAKHSGAMLSALFLLAFAMAIVVPWSTADSARQNTYAESQAVVEAYWSAAGLPGQGGRQVQVELQDYLRFVVDKEWPLMAKERLSPEGWSRLDMMRTRVIGLHVSGDEARDARNDLLAELRALSAARHQRAADAKATPPAGLLALTLLTGLAVMVFPFLVGERPRGMEITPLVVMAALLGVGIYLASNITHAFDGGLAVRPDAFTSALHELQRIGSG
jgi:hypothetical protein